MAPKKGTTNNPNGRPRKYPKGAPQPSRTNDARYAREQKRRKLPTREKERRKILQQRKKAEKANRNLNDVDTLENGGAVLDEDGLTVKERIYAENFLAYGSHRKACIAAGYTSFQTRDGEKRIYERPAIKAYIQREMQERMEHYRLTADNVLRNQSYLEHFDPALLFAPDGSPIPVNRLPVHVRYCIESIEVEDIYEGRGEDRRWIGHLVKYRFPSKAQIKVLSMKHLKLLDGSGSQNKDRLSEILEAFKAGPVKPAIEGQQVINGTGDQKEEPDGEQ